jgi:hypothetical protein
VGEVYYYGIRAENSCGMGTLGFGTNGVERTGPACN